MKPLEAQYSYLLQGQLEVLSKLQVLVVASAPGHGHLCRRRQVLGPL